MPWNMRSRMGFGKRRLGLMQKRRPRSGTRSKKALFHIYTIHKGPALRNNGPFASSVLWVALSGIGSTTQFLIEKGRCRLFSRTHHELSG